MSEVSKMTVVNLKDALKARGLDVSGLKAVLVARLEAAMANENEATEGETAAEVETAAEDETAVEDEAAEDKAETAADGHVEDDVEDDDAEADTMKAAAEAMAAKAMAEHDEAQEKKRERSPDGDDAEPEAQRVRGNEDGDGAVEIKAIEAEDTPGGQKLATFEVANGEIRRDVPTNSNEGRIIGRQGTKIRELQDRFRTKITMNRAMHLAEVVGKLADVNACCDEIMQIVAEGNVREAVDRAGQPMQAVGGARGGDRVGGDRGGFSGYMERVPCEGQEGRIIGRGGENIRRVESQTGTRIKMNRVECVAEVYGSPQQCAEAVRMIQEYIHTAPSRQGGGGGGYGQQQGGGYQQQGGYGQQQGGYGQQQHGGYQQGGYGGGYQQGGYQQGGYGGGYQQQAAAYGQQAQQRGGFPGASGAPLPHGWEEVNPGNGGPVYYWNTVTNATQYERPN